MHAAEGTGPDTAAWFVEPDHASSNPHVRRAAQARRNESTSLRAVIVASIFLVLLTTSLMVGGRAALDPLLRRAATRNGRAKGDVVYAMPDGEFCRHMSFDNTTDEMIEGTIERCPDDIVQRQFRGPAHRFSWGEH